MEEIQEKGSVDIYRFLAENKDSIDRELNKVYKINTYVRSLTGEFTATYKIQLHGDSMTSVEYDRWDKLTKLRESYKLLNTYLNCKQGFFTCCSNYLNSPDAYLKENAIRFVSVLIEGVSRRISIEKLEEAFMNYLENDETDLFVEQFKIDLANY